MFKEQEWEKCEHKMVSDSWPDMSMLHCGLRSARKEKACASEHGCCGWIYTHTRSRGLCNSYCLLRASAVRWEIPWSQSRHSKRAKLQQLNMSKCHPALAFLRVPFFPVWRTRNELGTQIWEAIPMFMTPTSEESHSQPKTGSICACISPLRDKTQRALFKRLQEHILKSVPPCARLSRW